MRRVLSNFNMLNIFYVNNFRRQKSNLSSSIYNLEQRIPDVDKDCHFVASFLVILKEEGGGRVLSNIDMRKLFYINGFGRQKSNLSSSKYNNLRQRILDISKSQGISPVDHAQLT